MELARQTFASIDSACEQFRTVRVKDPVFVESFEAAEELANNVRDLHVHLQQLYNAVDAMAEAQKLVAQDIRKMYKGDPTAAPAVKGFIRATRGLAAEMPGRMLPSLQKSVVGATEKWTERLAGVLTDASHEENIAYYKKFRHYKEKVGEMTAEKKSGRMNHSSQREAYSRNLDKLSGAKGEWFKRRDKVVSGMDKEVLAGMDEANKILLRLLQFSQAYYQQGSEACEGMNEARASVDVLVKNPPERTLKDRTEKSDTEEESEESESEESESEEEKPKKSSKSKKKERVKSGLSSSEDQESEEEVEEEVEEKPTKKSKSKKAEKKEPKKKTKKKESSDADDCLDDYVDTPSPSDNAGDVSPRTLEWQRKNEQRVLMGLPPKDHPAGPGYAGAKSGGSADMLSNTPAPSAEDDLLGAFGDLDMSITPAPPQPQQQQPAATAPATMNAFAQQPNAFAQQPAGNVVTNVFASSPQVGMMGQPMGGQQMMGGMGGQQMMGGQPMMMGGQQQNLMGQPMQPTLGQQQQMYNMQQMQQQPMQPNAFGQQNAFR